MLRFITSLWSGEQVTCKLFSHVLAGMVVILLILSIFYLDMELQLSFHTVIKEKCGLK